MPTDSKTSIESKVSLDTPDLPLFNIEREIEIDASEAFLKNLGLRTFKLTLQDGITSQKEIQYCLLANDNPQDESEENNAIFIFTPLELEKSSAPNNPYDLNSVIQHLNTLLKDTSIHIYSIATDFSSANQHFSLCRNGKKIDIKKYDLRSVIEQLINYAENYKSGKSLKLEFAAQQSNESSSQSDGIAQNDSEKKCEGCPNTEKQSTLKTDTQQPNGARSSSNGIFQDAWENTYAIIDEGKNARPYSDYFLGWPAGKGLLDKVGYVLGGFALTPLVNTLKLSQLLFTSSEYFFYSKYESVRDHSLARAAFFGILYGASWLGKIVTRACLSPWDSLRAAEKISSTPLRWVTYVASGLLSLVTWVGAGILLAPAIAPLGIAKAIPTVGNFIGYAVERLAIAASYIAPVLTTVGVKVATAMTAIGVAMVGTAVFCFSALRKGYSKLKNWWSEKPIEKTRNEMSTSAKILCATPPTGRPQAQSASLDSNGAGTPTNQEKCRWGFFCSHPQQAVTQALGESVKTAPKAPPRNCQEKTFKSA